MKSIFIALALLIIFPAYTVVIDGGGSVYAAEGRSVKKAKEKTASGIVKVIDPAAKAIVINGKDEIAFIAEEPLLRDIKINDRVIIKYKESGGKKYAHSIKTGQKKGKKR